MPCQDIGTRALSLALLYGENYFKDCVMGPTWLLDTGGLGMGSLEKNITHPGKFQFQVNSKYFKKYNCVSMIAWGHTWTKKSIRCLSEIQI